MGGETLHIPSIPPTALRVPIASGYAFQLQADIGQGLEYVPMSNLPGSLRFAGIAGAFTLGANWGVSPYSSAVMLQVTCKAASAGSIKIRLVTGIDMAMADYPSYTTKMPIPPR
jgi:hypothetical protein